MATPPQRAAQGVTASGIVVGIAVAIIVLQGLALAGFALPIIGGKTALPPEFGQVLGDLRNATAELRSAADGLRDAGKEFQASARRVDNASAALAGALDSIGEASDRLNASANRLADSAAALGERNLELDGLARNLSQEIQKLRDLQGGNATSNETAGLQQQVAQLQGEVGSLNGRLANQSLLVAALTVDLNVTIAENARLQTHVTLLEGQVANLTLENAALRQQLGLRPPVNQVAGQRTPAVEAPLAALATLVVAFALRRRAKP